MADVFFSYKREDRVSVERLVRLLEREGLIVWWDPTLVAGELFDEVISLEINRARCILVAWSASSVKARWVRDEASIGAKRGILVPFSLDGTLPPLGFGVFQTPDLSGWTGNAEDPRIRQLIAGVRRTVDNTVDGATSAGATAGDASRPWAAPPSAPASRMSRRRLLQIGLATGAVGAASAAGLWYATTGSRPSPPPAHTEEFDLVTVGPRGEPMPRRRESVDVFALPVGSTALEFSIIPGGGFLIGSPDDEPQRKPNEGPQTAITVPPFALGRTAVTQAQWTALVAAAPDTITHELDPTPPPSGATICRSRR